MDPHFDFNLRAHDSLGRACVGGHTVVSVDGTVMRAAVIVLGNIHSPDFAQALAPRACTAAKCGCHIGYVHLEHLKLAEVFRCR